jgi:hypothetical protein
VGVNEFNTLKKRQVSQLRENWPFLYSVDPQRGLVKNVSAFVIVEVQPPVKVAKKRWRGARHAIVMKRKSSKRRRATNFDY